MVASFGLSFVEPEDDDSHSSMSWVPGMRLLSGNPGGDGIRIALSISRLTLLKLGEGGEVVDQCLLAGKTLDDAYRWLADTVREETGEDPGPIRRPTHEMPSHSVGSGEQFGGPVGEALEELERWYSNAARVIEALAGENPDASPIRCWPHHFDLATLIVFDPDEPEMDRARSITVGMSPGDRRCAE